MNYSLMIPVTPSGAGGMSPSRHSFISAFYFGLFQSLGKMRCSGRFRPMEVREMAVAMKSLMRAVQVPAAAFVSKSTSNGIWMDIVYAAGPSYACWVSDATA